MTMHSFYFISYASILTVADIVATWAFYCRLKNYGTPVNYSIIGLITASAIAMWTGVAFTEYVYNPGTISGGFTIFFIVLWMTAAMYWQFGTQAETKTEAMATSGEWRI